MRGIVYKSTGSWYIIKTQEGKFRNARIKGKFKIDKEITSTNPIAVGDEVDVDMEDEQEDTLIITAIHPRKNYIVRTSPHSKYQKHIVASNLDQSIIIATLKDPKTSLGFIDRFLITCEAYHIPAVILFNKSDLLDTEALDEYHAIHHLYTSLGYTVHLLSAEKNTGLDILAPLLHHKTSLFTGHSGVGKSTLINYLIPHQELRTQEVSEWSGKGLHTTTFAEMYDLPQGGSIIDTPGIRELGIVDIPRSELSGYYPEMKKLLNHCKYNNCSHINEPGCAIKQALHDGQIHELRYISYLKVFDTISEKNY